MDVGLGPFEDAPGSPGQQPVLILVLVDVGLGRTYEEQVKALQELS